MRNGFRVKIVQPFNANNCAVHAPVKKDIFYTIMIALGTVHLKRNVRNGKST